MNLNTGLIILTICSSFFFAPNTFAQNSLITIAQEQVCRSSVQGRVAWNRAGNKNWQARNLNELCRGTSNARATVNCFKAQIRRHNDWNLGINACRSSASARSKPPACIKEDCYASAKLIKGGVKKFGHINIINDVKYGYHCGNGRTSKKRPLDQVDSACKFHDEIGGGKQPFTNGNGVTAAQSCSRQLRFVERLQKINRSKITNGASRARQLLLAQFPRLRQMRTLCGSISVGEGTVDGVEDALIGVGILNTSANEWGVDIDSCHSDLNHTGTKNGITVEFWASNKKVGTRYKNGVSDNCNSDDASYSFKTKEKITHVIVRTNGNDGFFIDELYLYKGGKLIKRHGRDNGGGWCLSTDKKDGKGAWKSKISSCLRQKQFNY